MKKVIFTIFFLLINLLFAKDKQIKVYDCFPFFNELELLEVRLSELYDEVDCFVLVENPLTQSGIEKPLFFAENKHKFEKFLDKIIHIVGPQRSQEKGDLRHWARENAQRDDILKGLTNAQDGDIIIISDLDEIVKKEKIKEIKDLIKNEKDPLRLDMKMYRYFLNRKDPDIAIWNLAYASSYKTLKKYSPEILRTRFQHKYNLKDAGWHFSDMGGIDRFIYKINACAHQDRNNAKWKDPKRIMKKARKCKKVKIDDTYPKYIVDNQNYFKQRNFIDDGFPIFWNLKIFEKRKKVLQEQ